MLNTNRPVSNRASSGGSTPSGTGFRYVTSGVEDSAARSLSASEILAALATVPTFFRAALKSGVTYAAGDVNPLQFDAAAENGGLIAVSGANNTIMAAVTTCNLQISLTCYQSGGSDLIQLIPEVNGVYAPPSPILSRGGYVGLSVNLRLQAGDELRILLYAIGTDFTPSLGADSAKFLRLSRTA